ncbi:MAG TPA: hypothetical protein VKB79_16245 [Bryobacteraceae bacterium]|nr:hypothetical protein [Bryobacteraceae bacterium]
MSSPLKFFFVALLGVAGLLGQTNALTGGYDNSRTNADLNETILSPSSVNSNAFGRLFALAVDGQIYAQPLYQQNVSISGGVHNVVFVATMHNTVYAFDADAPATPLWSVNLGPSVPTSAYTSGAGPYTDISPENGILGTPVIDPVTGTLYVVAASFESGRYFYRLHALDTGSGAERFGAPVEISMKTTGVGDSSVGGTVVFDPLQHIQRPALLLANGQVYIAFGSHGDGAPYHGWIVAYSAQNVAKQTAVFNASPNGSAGAFWQAGRGLTADASGNLFAVTSNGSSDFTTDYSNAVLKLDGTSLKVDDWFAPFDFQMLSDADDDLGTAGAMLIPGTKYLVTGGKSGVLYLIDQTSMGHVAANDSEILQRLQIGNFGIFNLALWNLPDGPVLYAHTGNAAVTAWKLSGGQFSSNPVAQSVNGFSIPFQGMALSANGTQPGTGILWVTGANTWPLPAPGMLHAYDAGNLNEIWNSSMNPADALGGFVKFANPTVANGKVYVPTMDGQLIVYGITSNAGNPPSVTGILNAASYASKAIAPGEVVAIFGQNLGPSSLATNSFGDSAAAGERLAGTEVLFNGIPAPLVYTSTGAVAAIVPFEIAGAGTATMSVSYNGQAASSQKVNLIDTAPGLFSADSSGSGPGAILNADFTLNTAYNPAQAGSFVVLYATGGGQTNPPSSSGAVATSAMPLAQKVSVTFGGVQADVLYAGNAGGEVEGIVQINVRVPSGVSGTVPVSLTVGGQTSQSTVTISIQ